jgi:NADH-quinone oxidoreductase subunit M
VGEFLALLGVFQSHRVLAVFATSGVIFAAYYMLPMVQRVFFNALEKPENREIDDLSRREMVILAPLCALMIWIGWNPTPLLERMEASVQVVIERVEAAQPAAQASIGDEVPEAEAEQPTDGGQD